MSLSKTLVRLKRAGFAAVLCSVGFAAVAEVHVPSGWVLEGVEKQGRAQFHLVAETIKTDIGDGKKIEVSGYNGSTSGPVLVVKQGQKFSVLVTNNQRAWTSFAVHGLETGSKASGLPGAGQKSIKTGETWEYEYTAVAPGIYRYGPHFEHRGQEQRGLVGAVLVLATDEIDQQHIVLTVHELSGKGGTARTLLNGRNAPEIDHPKLHQSDAAQIHVLNMSPRPQSLQIPGVNILRAGIGGDTHTAPRQGASFSFRPRAGEWWLYFADVSSKPFASAGSMPGMPGMPSTGASSGEPRLTGLSTKLIVKGDGSSKRGVARLVSSDKSFGSPKRKPH